MERVLESLDFAYSLPIVCITSIQIKRRFNWINREKKHNVFLSFLHTFIKCSFICHEKQKEIAKSAKANSNDK